MPVSSNFRATSAALCLLIATTACAPAPADRAPVKPDQSYDELANAIGEIKSDLPDFENLPGETRAEKLLYQAGIVAQMQTAMLVMFDTQARSIRMSGNAKLADELDGNRDIMMEVVNLELDSFIVDAGLLYEEFLTPEEIERLIELHTDPSMQKLILNQPKMSQSIIPIGESFGLRVGARYDELVQKRKMSE